MWIRLAAAAALERQGDVRGFPQVVRLLTDAPAGSRAMIRDLLISYAGKIMGRPLSKQEIERLGGPRAWSQWYTDHLKSKGLKPPDPTVGSRGS